MELSALLEEIIEKTKNRSDRKIIIKSVLQNEGYLAESRPKKDNLAA
jgi:hypothetical protein